MINSNDCVILSDDDDLNQVPEPEPEKTNRKRIHNKNNNHKWKRTKSNETIVLDEETSNHIENNNVIERPDSQDLIQDKSLQRLEKIRQDDKVFFDFIEKCLDLENSDGMIRIVHKTVITAYEECDKEYRKSSQFQRVLMKAIKRLDTDPDHKFSHVKDLVETLKLHKEKKRVQLTTLATNLKDKNLHSVLHTQKNGFSRKSRVNSIILDSDDEQRDIPTINLDDYQNDIVEVLDEEKENHVDQEKGLPISQDLQVEASSNIQVFIHQQKISDKKNHTENNESLPNSQENYLGPQVEVPWESRIKIQAFTVLEQIPIEYERANEKEEKIKAIEKQIAWCKEQIMRLDEAEVENDSVTSPYILCDKYKEQVVQLYKQLCILTGDQPVKQRKVRIRVLEGHPPGPTKRLETFINDNIGDDGLPLFPDFLDVIKCVMVANIEDKIGWNKQQVMREANSLFTQCGRALQKRRQRREYRDLISRVKIECPEYDPAEDDPELQRKLAENRKIAIKKENELLEKYVSLQYLPTQKPRSGPSLEHAKKIQTSHFNGDLCHENDSQINNHIEKSVPSSSSHLHSHVARSRPSCFSDIQNNNLENLQSSCSVLQKILENPQPTYSDLLNNLENPQPSCPDLQNNLENLQPSCSVLQKILVNPQPTYSDLLNNLENPQPSCPDPQNNLENPQPSCPDLQNNLENPQPSCPDLQNNFENPQTTCSDLQNNLVENPQQSPFSDVISDEDSDFEPPEVRLSQETAKTDLETENKDSEVKVKQEPLDIVQMLADLGDNYTVSIIDIEDPFLVIEISSDDDSSDEEMHVDGESD